MWIAACKADEIEPDDVVAFTHERTDYAIYRSPDDEYFATAGHCTHERELLCHGLVMDGEIECPKHLGRFSYATGEAVGPPALVDLATFPTRVTDGVVYLELSS